MQVPAYRILVVAPPWYPVPPAGYGGIEVVVDLLVRGLRDRGVDVHLIAAEGSGHDAIELAPTEWSSDLGHKWHEFREMTYVARALEAVEEIRPDLIHDHAGVISALAFGQIPVPALHTVHGPLPEQAATMYAELGATVGLVGISENQKSFAPELNWAGVVHNAVDVDALTVGTGSSGHLLCLARISPEKGQHIAIEVARETGRRLVLAGKVGERSEELAYFREHVEPHIDGDRVIYLDNVAGAHKAAVIADAHALLSPIQWAEPFGLAMVEAMASGTPCIAMARGAAPELVEPGTTGFLCESTAEMIEAVAHATAIDRVACAERARERFSPASMASAYLDIYSDAIEGGPAIAVLGSASIAPAAANALPLSV